MQGARNTHCRHALRALACCILLALLRIILLRPIIIIIIIIIAHHHGRSQERGYLAQGSQNQPITKPLHYGTIFHFFRNEGRERREGGAMFLDNPLGSCSTNRCAPHTHNQLEEEEPDQSACCYRIYRTLGGCLVVSQNKSCLPWLVRAIGNGK